MKPNQPQQHAQSQSLDTQRVDSSWGGDASADSPAKSAGVAQSLVAPNDPLSGSSSDQPLPSQIGRFTVKRLLGDGAFGYVYLANDPELDRMVAIKVPKQQRFTSDEQIAAFVAEARSAARLKHPGLVTVYDVQKQ